MCACVGAGEAESIFLEAAEGNATREPNILHEPARRDAGVRRMKRSRGCPGRRQGRATGRRALPIHQRPSGSPSRPWDKSNRERGRGGKKVSEGEVGGLRAEGRRGTEKAA